jgi:dynein heavy chain 2, cytosolic
MTSQLLAAALKHEKPELELRKSELLKVEEEHKLEIGRLEDFLLEELANATGNLVSMPFNFSSLSLTPLLNTNTLVDLVTLLNCC